MKTLSVLGLFLGAALLFTGCTTYQQTVPTPNAQDSGGVRIWTTAYANGGKPNPPEVNVFSQREAVVVVILPLGTGHDEATLEIRDSTTGHTFYTRSLVLNYGYWMYSEFPPFEQSGIFHVRLFVHGRMLASAIFTVQ